MDPGTKISHFRTRHESLAKYYDHDGDITYCSNFDGLMQELTDNYDNEEWRLFIDASKSGIKAVLLHNGNTRPSIPLAYGMEVKESYETMQKLLNVIKYSDNQWKVCGDLKVIALLLGLQLGYTKYSCFLCLWDSRDDKNHFVKDRWTPRHELVPGICNVKFSPLIDREKVFLPPLHIKLGLMKNFVKGLPKPGVAFQYLRSKFPKVSDAKLKEGVFVGPQIRKILADREFDEILVGNELEAWRSFQMVVRDFLGNTKAANYKDIVASLLSNYHNMGCRMSLKMHFLHSHLDFFPENLGAVSDEQGERFHQDIMTMEQRYQGRCDSNMMGDYCCFLYRETDAQKYKRQSKAKKAIFFNRF